MGTKPLKPSRAELLRPTMRLHQKTSIRMTQRMNTAVSSKSENPVLLHIHERGVPSRPAVVVRKSDFSG